MEVKDQFVHSSNSNILSFRIFSIALFFVGVVFLAVVSGISAAYGNVIMLIGLLAIYGVFFVLAAPVSWTVWLIFWSAFLITGPAAYFLRFSQLQWFTVLVSGALLLPILVNLLRNKTNILSTIIPNDFFWPTIFLLLVIFSTVIDQPKLSELVNASRHYLFLWPLMLIFMLGLVKEEMHVQLWKALLIVAILQFPMAIYQYFFVAKSNIRNITPWDAVIGTFHGAIDGGGSSAGMAIMLLIAILTATALWHGQKLHGKWMILVMFASLGTIVLAEVKAAVILLPIALSLYYRKELLHRPMESLVVVTGAILLVGGIFTAYEKLHYGEMPTHSFNQNQAHTTYDRVMRALDPEGESEGMGEIGRVNLLTTWWSINVMSGDIQHSLFGYGMGATSDTRLGTGELMGRFHYKINTSSSIILLWETGILGHLAFLLVLLYGILVSRRVAKDKRIPEVHRILLRVGSISLLILTITLPYKNFHLYSIPIQFLMMFMLGQAAYWSQFLNKTNKNK
ncbi:MAG: hypothetical protein DYH15_06535 [Nitrosomonas sp. PRO4]|nr:hypothetical protein [Nitrosomonas sp. PRO4]